MAYPFLLEATVAQKGTRQAADVLFMPMEAIEAIGTTTFDPAEDILGLRRGIPIATPDEVQDVLFASLSGRYVPFTPDSFDNWRPQRLSSVRTRNASFARQLTMDDVVPVSSSPIRGTSIANLLTQGSAWTVSSAEGLIHSPLHGLAVLVVSELGITIVQVTGALRSSLVLAAKYHARRRLGVPDDWRPPEDF